ncbi:zinc-binding alcohol dehydrogenase family protein [Rhizobium leguminosarum]|uniref:zinc-binding alcohol dehydrogenase family protein n=1 Tax=Rhizobium leguminosarum TaxID=384 RepID=UPI0014427259|nr:zinc-binding alcohol dehydrogenase family protein [Rhizobium leguminosarum]NKL67358.1 zinc-binding alcohol dehydrogenase family protein [Rhizobium leguminosarum bv. viciae]
MKAVGYSKNGSIDRDDALIDITLPKPVPTDHDLLVEISATAVNPIDYEIRRNAAPADGEFRVLGWDAVGIVVEKGGLVEGFEIGDRVYYCGALRRQGTNAEFNLVDARIAARAPASLSDAEAAALPLTSLTAWEMLFERLDVTRPVLGAAAAVLIIGGAGGVGSMAIQLLRAQTDLTVIATASRRETSEWCFSLGAHHVVDHSQPLAPQIEALGIGAPGFVFATAGSIEYREDIVKLMSPQGRYGYIDSPAVFDANPFKWKCISIHLEAVFMRSLMQTVDMGVQGDILRQVAELIEAGKIRTTLTETFGTINAANLKRAHQLLESGRARGKIVLEGF